MAAIMNQVIGLTLDVVIVGCREDGANGVSGSLIEKTFNNYNN
jgi:hypothetical protein